MQNWTAQENLWAVFTLGTNFPCLCTFASHPKHCDPDCDRDTQYTPTCICPSVSHSQNLADKQCCELEFCSLPEQQIAIKSSQVWSGFALSQVLDVEYSKGHDPRQCCWMPTYNKALV